jgi:cytoskeleton protein RodZ
MEQVPTEPPQLGQLLKEAREARGLSIKDVVQVLKFSSRQIEALEAGNLAALPGTVFVRGIVRGYARFLKLDAEPLLAMLRTDVPPVPPDVRAPDNMGIAMPDGEGRQIPTLVAISILLLVAAATMAGWHYLVPRSPIAAKQTAVSESTVPVASPQVRVEPEAIPVSASADATGQQAAPLLDGKQLIFEFRGTSWIEVKDASQQIILTGQFFNGNRQAVSGRPPFQLVIGNAALVDLRYDDREVDLKSHTRAEVARLTIE